MTGDFDQHRSVEYRDISRLFWNTYPFKVVVFEDIHRPIDRHCGDSSVYKAWVDHHHARLAFFYKRKRHCPADTTSWKYVNSARTFSFFFKNAEDAKHFITKNRRHVSTVFRPESENVVKALASNHRLILRDILFWNQYRYCIEFKPQPSAEADQILDQNVLHVFHNRKQTSRYIYMYSKRRRLYLKDENDVLIMKMALSEQFKAVTEALLKKDI